MRVVFMGSPEFAVPSLRALARSHDVAAVYTQPDRPRRRGHEVQPTPVKAAAVELGLDVVQPTTLRAPGEAERLAAFEPEVVCVAAYGLILPSDVLAVPLRGCLNVHASLLPRFRGAAPVHRAILAGDSITGVSIMMMEEGLDTGPFALVVEVPVGEADVVTLTAELAHVGAAALLDTLSAIEEGTVAWTPQDEADATYAEKINDTDLVLAPTQSIESALRRVRASDSSARAKALVCDRLVDIARASRTETDLPAGRVLRSGQGLVLGLSDGALLVDEVRPQGKQLMTGDAFACGLRLEDASSWSCP